MKFVIETDPGSGPAWWLVDGDRHVVAWAGRTFDNLAHADEAAHDFRVQPEEPEYRVHAKVGGRWWWTAWRAGGIRVAVSGGWFPSEESARVAALQVQGEAGTAIGP